VLLVTYLIVQQVHIRRGRGGRERWEEGWNTWGLHASAPIAVLILVDTDTSVFSVTVSDCA
jgi:hypothetical protein